MIATPGQIATRPSGLQGVALVLMVLLMAAASLYQLHSVARLASIFLYLVLSYLGLFYAYRYNFTLVLMFPLLVTFVFVCSVTDLSPIGTRLSRETGFATRQWIVFAGLVPCALAMSVLLGDLEAHLSNWFMVISVIILTGFTCLIYLQTNQAGMTNRIFIINNLYTIEVIRIYFWTLLIFRMPSMIVRMSMLAVFFFLAFSTQAQLAGLVVLGVMIFAGGTLVRRTALLVALMAIFAMALNYQVLLGVEHNFGVRALFWYEVMNEVQLTFGVGVGLGVESIPRFYQFEGDFRTFTADAIENLQVIGVHNAFFQYALNLGVLGSLLLVYFFWVVAAGRARTVTSQRMHTVAFLFLLISCCVNTAVDSPNFVNGTAFLLSRCMYGGYTHISGRISEKSAPGTTDQSVL